MPKPKAAFYIWSRIPTGEKSSDFTISLLERTGVLVVPGTGYGANGEGYFRISITTSEDRLTQAVERLSKEFVNA